MHICMEGRQRRDPGISIVSVNSLRIFIKSRKLSKRLILQRISKIESKVIDIIICSLVEGNPQKVLRLLHHLLFGVSKKFTDKFLKEKCGFNLDI